MAYVLKLFDTVILSFQAHRTLDGIEVQILELREEMLPLLPPGMQSTSQSLASWLRHRVIPSNRAYVQSFLSKNGLNEKDYLGILLICKGLSLTDSYWVTTADDKKTFAEINLFHHRFSQLLSQIAFTGYGASPNSAFRSSPEFTTNGMLPKAWRRVDGKIMLYKGGTSGFANSGNEPYSEYYAAQVCDAMGIKHIPYGLSRWKGQLCSTCQLFTSEDYSFVPAASVIRDSGISKIISYYESRGWRDDIADMLILDAVIRNTDRHAGNFGFIVDSHTAQIIRPAPLFDHGLSLYCYVLEKDLSNLQEQESSLSPALYADFDEAARLVMGPKQREHLRHLLDFRFARHKRYNLPVKRLQAIESAIQSKARELLNG